MRLTTEAVGSTVPAGAFSSMTVPTGRGSTTPLISPIVRPARWIRAAAVAWSTPTATGTVVVGRVWRTMTLALVAVPESIFKGLPETQSSMRRTLKVRDPPQVVNTGAGIW